MAAGGLNPTLCHGCGEDTVPKRQVRARDVKRYTGLEFRPYVTALGQFALAWNDLQEFSRLAILDFDESTPS